MFKKIVFIFMVLFFVSSVGYSNTTPIPSVEDNVRSIETICKKYYDRNEDCPFDEIIGVPKAESRTNRFDVKSEEDKKEEDVKKEMFRSN
jgi:hypothetical protein